MSTPWDISNCMHPICITCDLVVLPPCFCFTITFFQGSSQLLKNMLLQCKTRRERLRGRICFFFQPFGVSLRVLQKSIMSFFHSETAYFKWKTMKMGILSVELYLKEYVILNDLVYNQLRRSYKESWSIFKRFQ